MAELDRIHIRDLRLRCIIGFNEWERREKQDITINLVLFADLGVACRSDDVADTIDYKEIKKRVIGVVEGSRCHLLEALAEQVADCCLADARLARVEVMIDKPGALRFARSVAVAITRERTENA